MGNYDKQEFRKYTGKSERDKFLNILKGLLTGIDCDKVISKPEIDELMNWCSLLGEYSDKKPFDELLPIIRDALSDNILTSEEISDIIWVIEQFTSVEKNKFYDPITNGLQQLQGILHGIMADNNITDYEIKKLKTWINTHDFLEGYYPYDEISTLLTSILSDGMISDDEKNILKVFFSEFIDQNSSININFDEIENLKNDFTIDGICAICPEIEFNNKTFCFTGASNKATRKEFEEIIMNLNGTFLNGVSGKTDYLIIGNNGNPCWAYSCYGRKVEQAITQRKKGNKVIIMHESDFWDAVEDLK